MEMPIIRGIATGLYALAEDEYCQTVKLGKYEHTVTVKEGFVFDGASIPRFLWRVCGHPFEVPRVAAGLLHDWLYAARVTKRSTADAIYRRVLIDAGWGKFRAFIEWFALRLFGSFAWYNHGQKDRDRARNRGYYYRHIINPTLKGE